MFRSKRVVRRGRVGVAAVAAAVEALESRQLLSAVTLDAAFGSGGKVLADFGTTSGHAMAVLPSGKVLVAGAVVVNGDSDFLLARYNADGSLDATFGDGGKVVTDLGSVGDRALAMAVQSDGKIVLAGQVCCNGSFYDFAVARYDAGGALDSGFGDNGKVVVDFAGAFDQATGVAVDGMGRIVVAGAATVGDDVGFALMRLDAGGMLDGSFGAAGKVTTLWGGMYAEAAGVAVTADGGVVVAGYAYDYATGGADAAVARYDAGGALDASFGAGGLVLVDFGRAWDAARAVAVLADGRVVLGGYADDLSGDADFALARLSAGGELDAAMGVVLTDFGGVDQAHAMAVAADGSVVLAGRTDSSSGGDFAVARFSADGALDANFGAGGRIVTDMGQDDAVAAVAANADGSVFAMGSSIVIQAGASTLAMARYAVPLPPPPPPPDPDPTPTPVYVPAEVVVDPVTGEKRLVVTGTDGDDVIRVRRHRKTGMVEVWFGDALKGLFQADRLIVHAGAGDDVVKIDDTVAMPAEVSGGDGDDVIKAGKGPATLHGDAGRDLLFGGASANVLDGGDGNDLLMVGRHNKHAATLFGGGGNDVLFGGRGDDLLDGGDGRDHLHGREGADQLLGGTGKDKYHRVGHDDVVSDPDDGVKVAKKHRR